MTDHTIDEGQRIIALATLHLAEVRARSAVAKVLIENLTTHSHHLSRDDQRECALEIWDTFMCVGARPVSMPTDMQAGVFAQAALWLTEDDLLRTARAMWGEIRTDAGDGVSRVTWLPDDEMLVLNVGHLHSDGTTMQVQFVISPMRMAGWVR